MKIELSENAKLVLARRYLKKDSDGNPIETPEDMFIRTAKNIASAEKLFDPQISKKELDKIEEEFLGIMCELEFLPNSPTLMNAGREIQQLSACFVLPVEDSIESIFETIKNTAIIHKSGGGTGFDFSPIRPQGSSVKTTMGIASGPISFITVFDSATEAVKQGGTRRGANMGILSIDHPDIISFIQSKEDNTKLNNFNLSVSITDEFMEKVFDDEKYSLTDPVSKKIVKKLPAKEVFNLIVEMAYKNGEPGVIFIDTINRYNPIPHVGRITATNPCGEQPLLPFESCNLGSINLSKVVSGKSIDFKNLKRIVTIAVRLLDNIIEVNQFPIPQIEKVTKMNRKIGLGVMGFADMLLKMNIPYNSNRALEIASEIMNFISINAKAVSSALAGERGLFPSYKGSIYEKEKIPMRNSTTTTIAPTGTLSIIANCSSGIEPIFGVSLVRNVLGGEKLFDVHQIFEEIAKEGGYYSPELIRTISEKGSLKDVDAIPENIKKLFVCAHDISPDWHIKVQSKFQEWTDNAVSKTINFPFEAAKEQIAEAYILSYKSGCKGITVYRDRSREKQVIVKTPFEERKKEYKRVPRPRPTVIHGTTEKVSTGCGHLYVTINYDKKGPFELFARLGKTGGCAASQTEAISRLISLSLRSNIDIDAVLKQLSGIRCPSQVWQNGELVLSCPDAISKTITNFFKNLEYDREENPPSPPFYKGGIQGGLVAGSCPDCGSPIFHEGGCLVCRWCGFSKCG